MLDEAQAGIKIAGRNINNLTYADDTSLKKQKGTKKAEEREEELKSLLMKVKEESENPGLKLNIQKTKIMVSGPITSRQTDGETMETIRDFIFLGPKITADGDCSYEIKKQLLLGRNAMTNLDNVLKSITLLTKVSIVKAIGFSRRRKWQPTPVFLPREPCGQRTLVGCCLWSRKESDRTEVTACTCREGMRVGGW